MSADIDDAISIVFAGAPGRLAGRHPDYHVFHYM